MDHVVLIVAVNLACFMSGIALGIALESWRRNRGGR
jgi:hypothetical protein